MDKETIKKVYMDAQAASGLKVGDFVKILRKAENEEGGWDNNWHPVMNKYIGKIGKIYSIGDRGIVIDFPDADFWSFPYFILEKATTPKDIQQEILESIKASLHHSREKHPVFANSKEHAVSLLTEEVGEVAMAVNDNDKEATKKELLDVIAVCLRWLEGDLKE